MAAAVPDVTLLPHPADPALRRARMTVEILDGYVQLSRWASAEVADRARAYAERGGVHGPARDAVVEAAMVAAAARDARAGQRPTADADRPRPPHPLAPNNGAAVQVTQLIRVATALRRSPAVAAALDYGATKRVP